MIVFLAFVKRRYSETDKESQSESVSQWKFGSLSAVDPGCISGLVHAVFYVN